MATGLLKLATVLFKRTVCAWVDRYPASIRGTDEGSASANLLFRLTKAMMVLQLLSLDPARKDRILAMVA